LLNEARAKVAAYVNVPAEDLVFIHNATTGVNIVARSLDLRPGDEVLTTNLEYGACAAAWRHACDKAGAHYVERPVTLPVTTAEQVVEEVWSGVTPRTRVLYLSHITSGTALRLPIEELCRRARAAGILSVIDGAHAPGQIPVDLTAIGADIYAGNCHKWLCAPKGSGFLHVRPEHQAWMESMIVSWGWVEGHNSFQADNQFVSRNQWQGTGDYAAYLSVPAAIAFQQDHDWPAVRALCHDLAVEAEARILAFSGLPPISPAEPPDGWPWFAQMRAIPLPPVDLPQLKQRLYDDDRIEVPLVPIPTMPLIRVSVQAYNSQADIDALVGALARILPELAV
jgi:isopenicillin-N epimerase